MLHAADATETNATTDPARNTAAPAELVPKPAADPSAVDRPVEIGGPQGPEPTRYGDWEKRGRCIDF